MAAVRQWARQLEDRELRGRVVAVPVLNLPSFRARSPFIVPDDGKNLNRCFPGDPAGTPADRLPYPAFPPLISGSHPPVPPPPRAMGEALAVGVGESVAEGQLLGTVSSLDGGGLLQTITAPAAGVPMFITSSPAVAAEGLLLGLGAS